MGKKRRQHATTEDGSGESTESEEGSFKAKKCSHLSSAVNINNLRKIVKKTKTNNKCVDCEKKDSSPEFKDENMDEPYNLWICLQCGHTACGRDRVSHAEKHHKTPRSDLHCIVIDTHKWSLWCYKCDDNVTNRNFNSKEITDLLKKWLMCPSKKSTLSYNEILYTNSEETNINSDDIPLVGGLQNLGNTCFFNAVLQCLAQTPYLIKVLDDLQVPGQKFVLSGGKIKGTDNSEIDLPPIEGVLEKSINTNNSFTPVLRKTLAEMQKSGGEVYKPAELLNSLKKKTAQCTDGGQHDSHELLRHLLEFVRNEDLMRYKSVILKEAGLSDKVKRQHVDDNVRSQLKYYDCQASAKLLGPDRVFRGELESTLECLVCHHSSSRTEPFLDLSLPVQNDNTIPPVLRRKGGVVMDSELNEAHKSNKKNRITKQKKKKNRENIILTSNTDNIFSEKKENVAESEESDADIEDNIENEDVSVQESSECGYSSEKPSTATNSVSLAEFHSADENIDPMDLNVSVVKDNLIHDTTEEKINIKKGLSLASSIVPLDFISPESPSVSPLSSPFTSKDSATSPISSTVDGDEIEKPNKLILKLDNTEKHKSNTIEDSIKKKIINMGDEKSSLETDKCTINKVNNGMSDLTSTVKKLNLSSSSKSPTRYVTKEGECSIQLCLNQFTALELMTGNNKVGCEACTEREKKGKLDGVKMVCTDSTKQYRISRVPAVLILHLKRFQVQKFSFRKLGKAVSFPMLLDLAPVSKDYTKRRIYALYGVVEHSGTLYGGHYVAYVKSRPPLKANDPRWSFLPSKDSFESKDNLGELNSDFDSNEASVDKSPPVQSPPGRWYFISDTRVREVDEKTVLASEAYLLFYERIL